jgi:hypothetical protein
MTTTETYCYRRIRHRANASVVELVCGRLLHACGLAALFAVDFAYLGATTGRRCVAEAKQSIDRALSRLNVWLE